MPRHADLTKLGTLIRHFAIPFVDTTRINGPRDMADVPALLVDDVVFVFIHLAIMVFIVVLESVLLL